MSTSSLLMPANFETVGWTRHEHAETQFRLVQKQVDQERNHDEDHEGHGHDAYLAGADEEKLFGKRGYAVPLGDRDGYTRNRPWVPSVASMAGHPEFGDDDAVQEPHTTERAMA